MGSICLRCWVFVLIITPHHFSIIVGLRPAADSDDSEVEEEEDEHSDVEEVDEGDDDDDETREKTNLDKGKGTSSRILDTGKKNKRGHGR